jgi:hypothetical protein
VGKLIELTGQRFGRLTVLARVANGKGGNARWLCRCNCGNEREILAGHLKSGDSRSCGCLQRELVSLRLFRHGHRRIRKDGRGQSTTYLSWNAMRERCYNRNYHAYARYGGRGISVCDRWLGSFEDFLADMGERPPGKTIDRRDNDGNYEPENCFWATKAEQARNKRSNRWITFQGEARCLAEWAELFNVRYNTLRMRLSRGWTLQCALTTPVSPSSRRPSEPPPRKILARKALSA